MTDSPDVRTDTGFTQYSIGVATLIAANQKYDDSREPYGRVKRSAETLEVCAFTSNELRAMLAIALDRLAFPQDWK